MVRSRRPECGLRSWIDTYIPRDAEHEIFVPLRSRSEASPFSDRRRSRRRRPDRRICVTTAPRGRHTVKTAFFHRLSLEALACWTTLFNISARQKKGFCERNDSSCGDPTHGGFKIAVLDQCSVIQLPAEIHITLNWRFRKIRLDNSRWIA